MPTPPAVPAGRRATFACVAAAAIVAILAAVAAPRRDPLLAQQESPGLATTGFIKVGKTYVNMNMVTHIINDPGYNLPPKAVQVFFGTPGTNFVNLFGDDAEAFRAMMDKNALDLTPAPKPAAKAAVAAKKGFVAKKAAPAAPPPASDPGQ